MEQTWRIKGVVYTHGQLMELKAQGLDPRKDQIVLAAVTPRKPVKNEKCTVTVTPEMAKEYPELEEQGVNVGDKMEVGDVADAAPESLNDLPLSQLKTMAKAQGYKTSNKTKKQELLDFLDPKKTELESNEAAQ